MLLVRVELVVPWQNRTLVDVSGVSRAVEGDWRVLLSDGSECSNMILRCAKKIASEGQLNIGSSRSVPPHLVGLIDLVGGGFRVGALM
ncbi:MAG TPA: hypothetical protein DCF45_13550 [Gammaproteobacteria bacterium]|nr:hypothetical protein [Gammaproteobacteria bacterium]